MQWWPSSDRTALGPPPLPTLHDTVYVFLELAEALRQGKTVLPVLIEDTAMPSPDALPGRRAPRSR